jgi:hypothetical protein
VSVLRGLLSAAAVLALAGCSGGEVVDTSSGQLQTPDAPSAEATPPAPTATPAPRDCDTVTRAELDDLVGAQLAAFAADDYAGALAFATEQFRSGFDPQRFREVIEGSFPLAAAGAAHEFGRCLTAGDAASAVVVLRAEDGAQALVYQFAREGGGWRIGGAVPADVNDDDELRSTGSPGAPAGRSSSSSQV